MVAGFAFAKDGLPWVKRGDATHSRKTSNLLGAEPGENRQVVDGLGNPREHSPVAEKT